MNILDSPDFKRALAWWKHPQGGRGYAGIAFAGTRLGMLPNQREALKAILRCLQSELRDIAFHHGDWVGAATEAHELAMPVAKVTVHPPFVAFTDRPEDKAMQKCASSCIGHYRMPRRIAFVRNEVMTDACNVLLVAPSFDARDDEIPMVTTTISMETGLPERIETPYVDYLDAYARAREHRSVLALLPEVYSLRTH